MRKLILIIAVIISFTSCDNFKESEAIEHITRTWTVYKYEVDGYDQTPLFVATYGTYTLVCEKDQDYTETYTVGATPVTITGIYIFSDGDNILTLSDEFQSRVFNVLTLTNNEMTLEDRNADTNQVYYLEAVI
ncbi:MAG TPA: hypothetical protein PK511_08840 [Chitinophagales bacterium]|nr:hypothetical protein [Chitinophagales bacterium]HMU68770.1 hypothetical protein [Chitinophagales bacterium]HMX03319.1 hypothetical protein [Chitinophagales bacterium]HMZ87964.1 hypothetical protein [Chitinophagales bacterium]HNA58645.1 hypothetical protein [Chitinophagales bacterium]